MTQLEIDSKELLDALTYLRTASSQKGFSIKNLSSATDDLITFAEKIAYLAADAAIVQRQLIEDNEKMRSLLRQSGEAMDDLELEDYFGD